MIALFGIGRDAGSPACPCDRSDLRFSSSSLSASAARTASLACWTAAGVVARDDDVEAVRAEAGRLGDRDVVAVGLDRREQVGEVDRVRRQVDVVVRGGRPSGRCWPAGRSCGDDGLEAGLALAGDRWSGPARRWDRWAGSSRPLVARSRTASGWRPAGGATVTARMFSRARVDERGREQRRRSATVTRNSARATPTTPSLVQRLRRAAVIAGRVGADPERVLGLAVLVDVELDLVDEQVREDRDDRQRAHQRGQQREGDGQGERQEELAHEAADEAERQEHADRGDRRRRDGARDLLAGR